MTTTITGPTAHHHDVRTAGAVTLRRVIGSEWIKFRTLRSSGVTLGAAVLVMIGLGPGRTSPEWHPRTLRRRPGTAPTRRATPDEQFDRVAGRVFQQDLADPWAGDDVVAEVDPGRSRRAGRPR